MGLRRLAIPPAAFRPNSTTAQPLPRPQARPDLHLLNLSWAAPTGRVYQVEYSPDLGTWFASPTGEVTSTGPTASWTDSGPPGTPTPPFTNPQRFYRVFQFGAP